MKKILAFVKLAFVLAVFFSLGLYPVSMVSAQIPSENADVASEVPAGTPGPTPAPDADADAGPKTTFVLVKLDKNTYSAEYFCLL